MRVSIQGNFDDQFSDMESLIDRLGPILAEESDRKWNLGCGGCQYLGPWSAALIASTFLIGKFRGQNPRVQLPTQPPALAGFCQFSGLEHLCRRGPSPDENHPSNETLAIRQFREASWNQPDPLIRLISRHVNLDEEVEDLIRTCVSEVVQNVVDHADSPIGGLMCAKFLASRHEVRVGIVDRGVGIEKRLQHRFPDVANAEDALGRVLRGGYSSLSRPNNLGLGVSNLFVFVRNAGGRIVVFSTGASARWEPGLQQPRIARARTEFPGTAVLFSLPTDQSPP